MSTFNIYQEIFDTHNNFYKTYLKEFSPEIDITKFSNWRLSYINYMTDVKYYYIKIIYYIFSILMIFSLIIVQKKWL